MRNVIECKDVEVIEVGFERTVSREFNSGDMVTVPSGDKAEVLFFAKPEQKYAVLLDSNTTGEVELFEASELTKCAEGCKDMRELILNQLASMRLDEGEAVQNAFESSIEELINQYEDDSVTEICVQDVIVSNFDKAKVVIDDDLLAELECKWDDLFNSATLEYQNHTEEEQEPKYTDALMRSIVMFAELVRDDYNGTPHCKARLGELVDELLAEGYESTEELKVGDTVVTNKKGYHHNVGKVYELTFDGSYIVTFGGIYIAQCYDREELILI